MAQQFTLPSIPDEERTPLVNALLGIISLQAEQIQLAKEQIRALRDEVAVLKGLKKKPKIPKSKLEGPGPDGNKDKQGKNGKRPGSAKRSKTSELEINDSVKVPLEGVNDGWEFKGCVGRNSSKILSSLSRALRTNTLLTRKSGKNILLRWVSTENVTSES